MEITSIVYLALGSNSGKREENILSAIQLIDEKIGVVQKVAKNFENEAFGFISDTLFLNTCIQVQTNLNPTEILAITKTIESDLGRKPKITDVYNSRTIDIDIIIYGDLVLNTSELKIPHIHFRLRDFVLVPLHEIAPHVLDPVTELTIKQLLKLKNSEHLHNLM
jgi:2-amino-4-hydroxy-6-hydroxymethyldihydropteridine diphosphokinase